MELRTNDSAEGDAARDLAARHINFIPFKLACPFLPTMMWSCTEKPSGAAMSTIALLIWIYYS
jgi:hypothetical protein